METEKWTKHLNIVAIIGVVIAILSLVPYTNLSSRLQIAQSAPRQLSAKDLAAEYRKGCPPHRFSSVKILSREPYAVIIEDFVTPAEAEFLVKTA